MSTHDPVTAFRAHVAAPSERARSDALRRLEHALQPTPRRRLAPWLARRATVVLATAVALAAVVAGLSTIGGEPGVLERAQAAVAPHGRVLHVVVRIVDPSGTQVQEAWNGPDGTGRTVTRSGAPAGECVGRATEMRCYDPSRGQIDVYRYHPEAVAAGRRRAQIPGVRIDEPASVVPTLRAGYARVLGRQAIAGRDVFAIELAIPFIAADGTATPTFDERSPVLYVDPDTYEPVAQHFPSSDSTTYYETFEFLPNDAETRRLLELDAPTGTPVVVHPVGEGPSG